MQDTDDTLVKAAARFAGLARTFASSEGMGDDDVTPELADMLAVLAEQAEWRVFVDGTRNFGHQASTVMILRRLIDLTAFAGRVVVVYADHRGALLGCMAAKLALMFAGVDPARMADGVAAYGTCKDIRFLPFKCRAELTVPAAFGFTGGADDMSVNYALQLNVRFFARIQPYLWDDPPSARTDPYYECSRIEQPEGGHLYVLEAYPEFQRLAIKPARPPTVDIDPAIWRWYADEQSFDESLACRTRNVHTVLASCGHEGAQHGNSPWLWPLYGLQHFKDKAAEMFLVCVLAAIRCQIDARRPIVLCSFSPHDELNGWAGLVDALASDVQLGDANLPALRHALACRHARELSEGLFSTDRLDAWMRRLSAWIFDRPTIANVLVHRAYDTNTGQWTDITEHLNAVLRATMPAVHIVELGLVPMDVFHHCVTHGDLPSVIEGQAASNLMTSLGRPFLQVLRDEHVIKNGYPISVEGQDFARMAEEAARVAATLQNPLPDRWLVSASTTDSSAYYAGIDRVVAFLRGAGEASSDVARYFRSVGHHFSRNPHDKLLVALLALREVVLAGADGTST